MGEKNLRNRCKFTTKRLNIKSWNQNLHTIKNRIDLAKRILNILTPSVTKSLPQGWQTINTQQKSLNWIEARDKESPVFLIELLTSREIIGFLFLNENFDPKNEKTELKIGYLISEQFWRKGFGSELVKGLVEWCELDGEIRKLSGGVEKNNTASIKVLKKNGFVESIDDGAIPDVIFLEKLFKI